MKGLRASIMENKDIGNCSNGGISSCCSSVTIVGEGIPEIFEADEISPAVKIVERQLFGNGKYLTAYPVKAAPESQTGYMFGGTFIWSSDSRFPAKYPVPLHDRTETGQQYEELSK